MDIKKLIDPFERLEKLQPPSYLKEAHQTFITRGKDNQLLFRRSYNKIIETEMDLKQQVKDDVTGQLYEIDFCRSAQLLMQYFEDFELLMSQRVIALAEAYESALAESRKHEQTLEQKNKEGKVK